MQIALGVIFLFLLIAVLTKAEALTPRGKTVIIAILSMIVAAAVLYEFMFSKTEQQNRTLINAFKQGKTISCKDANVNQKNYILETGTMSFMAKENNKTLAGIIYSIKDCSIKP